jgi:uncharacterized repeat protein (TIGR02543 family)
MLFCAGAFAQDLPKAAVTAPVKQRVAVLPSVGDLEPQGLILLTDKVREIATKNLPMENYNILKLDAITKMIGEEELYRACKEGVCIGDLARKTDANYGARCDVIKFNNRLVLKFEIYSVNEDAIFETFTDYNVKDFYGMLAVLEARLPATFQKMVLAYDRALADAKNKAIEQQKQEQQKLELQKALADARDKAIEQQKLEAKAQQEKPTPAPVPEPPQEPPETYTVAAAANPPDGGTVSRNPNYRAYYAGTQVTLTATPSAGYTFAGWNGVTAPAKNNSNIIITVEDNWALTANFQRIPAPPPPPPPAAPPRESAPPPYVAPQQPKPHKKTAPAVVTLRVSSAVVAAGGLLIGGFVFNGDVQKALDKYDAAENPEQVKEAKGERDSKIALRNTMYAIAGVGLAGFAVTLFF